MFYFASNLIYGFEACGFLGQGAQGWKEQLISGLK